MNYKIESIFSKEFIIKFLKFALIGGIGTLINLVILFLFTEIFSIYYIISEIIAFLASLTNNYILNKKWTFKEKLEEMIIKKYFKYFSICFLSLIVNLLVLSILVELFFMWYIFAEIFAIAIGFLINFLGNYIWTFKNQ